MRIGYTIDCLVDVDFEGEPEWANEKASYTRPHDYLQVTDITWDTAKHTEAENKIITDFLSKIKNYSEIESMLCDQYQDKYDWADV